MPSLSQLNNSKAIMYSTDVRFQTRTPSSEVLVDAIKQSTVYRDPDESLWVDIASRRTPVTVRDDGVYVADLSNCQKRESHDYDSIRDILGVAAMFLNDEDAAELYDHLAEHPTNETSFVFDMRDRRTAESVMYQLRLIGTEEEIEKLEYDLFENNLTLDDKVALGIEGFWCDANDATVAQQIRDFPYEASIGILRRGVPYYGWNETIEQLVNYLDELEDAPTTARLEPEAYERVEAIVDHMFKLDDPRHSQINGLNPSPLAESITRDQPPTVAQPDQARIEATQQQTRMR